MKKPKSFFQFQKFDDENYSINNLKTHSIYFSDPKDFNDPFDAKPNLISVEINSKEELDTVKTKLWPKATNEVKDYINSMKEADLIDKITEKWKELIAKKFSECGISCFTEKIENNVFWYSYSNNHTGFCTEFDPRSQLFERVFKVNYDNNYPIIKAAQIGYKDQNFKSMIDQIFTNKSEEWSYENEWRLIHRNKLQSYNYNIENLRSVSLGKDCSKVNESIVRDILDLPIFKNVILYKMEIAEKSYFMNRVRIN